MVGFYGSNMATKAYTEEVAFVEEGEHVFYIDGKNDTAVLPKDHLSDYVKKQLRDLMEE